MWQVGRLVAFTGVLATMLAMVPADVLAQKKKKDDAPKYPTATEADYGGMKKTVLGKIASFDGGKSVTFRVETPHQEANPNYKSPSTNPKAPGYNSQAAQQANLYRKYLDLQTQMQRAATARTPSQAATAQARIQTDMINIQLQAARLATTYNDPNNQPFRTVTTTKDYELDLEDKVTYRKTFLPKEYDDEGNLKTYTAEEKQDLKLDDKLFKSSVDEVQNGQEAKLYLTLPKKKSKTDDDSTPPEHPTVNKIVLTKEAPATTSTPDDGKKKKKKN